jgi:hypothetical protein
MSDLVRFEPKACPLESTPEMALLPDVTQARRCGIQAARAQQVQETRDVRRSTHRHDSNALGLELPATAPGKRLERQLVAEPFDEHDRATLLGGSSGELQRAESHGPARAH